MRIALALALCGGLTLSAPVFAAEFDSVYTKIDFDQCLVLESDELGASFACPGYKGFPLYIAEGDLRLFVSYGFGAPDEMAAHQTLPQFNSLGNTLEWRLSNTSGHAKPVATILRWFTQTGDPNERDGQKLIVTQIVPGNTCHIAYIDALLTKNANEIARQWADRAGTFNCQTDEPARIPD